MHIGQSLRDASVRSCSSFAVNARNYSPRYFRLLVFAFICTGAALVYWSVACETIVWANIYRVSDFDSARAVLEYVKNLRLAIPIVISLIEIACYNVFGDTTLVTHILYRVAMVLGFVLAISLAYSSVRNSPQVWIVYSKTTASFLMSLVFIAATVLIHSGNPQSYDIFFPCFSLLYIFLLEKTWGSLAESGVCRRTVIFSVASGFFLSMSELSRPFVFYVLPLLLVFTWLGLRVASAAGSHAAKGTVPFSLTRKSGRSLFLWFLLPVVVFSGVWHAFIYFRHGQVIWSNNTGFNLYKAWRMVEMPELVPEAYMPIKKDRWPSINTAEHFENSKRLQRAIFGYMASHPLRTVELMYKRVCSLMVDVKTSLYSHKPECCVLTVYRPVVWAAGLWLLINAAMLAAGLVKKGFGVLGAPEHILIVMTAAYIFFLAVGDTGEEARFLISLLPFLAALPGYIKAPVLGNERDGSAPGAGASFPE